MWVLYRACKRHLGEVLGQGVGSSRLLFLSVVLASRFFLRYMDPEIRIYGPRYTHEVTRGREGPRHPRGVLTSRTVLFIDYTLQPYAVFNSGPAKSLIAFEGLSYNTAAHAPSG